jgi:hypothetical protein
MKEEATRFSKSKQTLIGQPVSSVWRGHGSALFIELGQLRASQGKRRDGTPMRPSGECTLMIEWSWRIEVGRSICCGSWSDEALWEPAFKRLVGCEVETINNFGRLPEIAIGLSGDHHVLSFMTADGDPQWALIDRREGANVSYHVRDGQLCAEVERSQGGRA